MGDFDHLNERARRLVDRPDEERIADILRPRYIKTVEGDAILDDLEELFREARIRREHGIEQLRPEGRILAAETGLGKTTIINAFLAKHPCKRLDDVDIKEVIRLEPDKPGEIPFLDEFLSNFDPEGYLVGNVEYKKKRARGYAKACGVTMIIVDEADNMLKGTHRQLELTWSLLKTTIANKFGIPIVIAGTPEKSESTISYNKQLRSRYKPTPALNKITNSESVKNLLHKYERDMPLKKASNLYGAEKSEYIFKKSDGRMADIIQPLSRSAIWSSDDGSECITMNHLKRIYDSAS